MKVYILLYNANLCVNIGNGYLLRYFTILKLFLVVDEIQFRKQCPPKFIVPIQGSMVEEGQKVVLNGIFDGSPEPSVLWFHNQKPVRPSHDVKIEVGSKETSISFAKVRYKFFCFTYTLRGCYYPN